MAEDDAADRQDCVDSNTYSILELMVAKDDWGGLKTSSDADAAIVSGNGYSA
jgi:hypothetical protein